MGNRNRTRSGKEYELAAEVGSVVEEHYSFSPDVVLP